MASRSASSTAEPEPAGAGTTKVGPEPAASRCNREVPPRLGSCRNTNSDTVPSGHISCTVLVRDFSSARCSESSVVETTMGSGHRSVALAGTLHTKPSEQSEEGTQTTTQDKNAGTAKEGQKQREREDR